MKATVARMKWAAEEKAWLLPGTYTFYGRDQHGDLKILGAKGAENHIIGTWHYDDVVNGILPGPVLTIEDNLDEMETSRCIPSSYFMSTTSIDRSVHGNELMKKPLWQKGPYVPGELVLVKGPTKTISEFYREEGARVVDLDVLVLAKVDVEGRETLYRRVGVGCLGSWDEDVGSVEILKII